MLLSNRWHVQLGEGGRRMTDSQIKTAAERCWIDAETPVRKPQSSEWTKLGDAAPAKRITAEKHVAEERDIDTSAMILLSGEFELVDDGASPSNEELAAARPPRLASKLFVAGLAMLAGGTFLAHRYVPRFDAELQSVVAAMRPAPLPSAPLPTTTPAVVTPAVVAPAVVTPPPAPVAAAVSSSATLAIVPKMRAPSPPPKATTATKPKTPAKAKRRHGAS